MSVNRSTETIQTTISQLNRDFSGRIGSTDYIESALLHIHRRNRAFVWGDEMQKNLLDSILQGYYIPPIICCSRIVNGMERREIMEGGNRMTTVRRILQNEVRRLTDPERHQVESFGISLVVMRNLSNEHQRKMFRRLNKGVKVSDGQLYAMSIDDSPLVKEAHALLTDDNHPLRGYITSCFKDTRNYTINKSCVDLANAVAIISGVIHGPNFITKSYNLQDPHVDDHTPIDTEYVNSVLRDLFCIFQEADQQCPIKANARRAQWNVGMFIGPMLYDYVRFMDKREKVKEKWLSFILRTRKTPDAKNALKLGGGQNLTATRHARVSAKVDIYQGEGRFASDDELRVYEHKEENENSESDEDDYTDEDDEKEAEAEAEADAE